MFFLSRIIVPNLGFKRRKIPEKIPREFMKVIIDLKKISKSKEDFAKKSYNYFSNRFHSEPGRVWADFPFLFIKRIDKLWGKKLLHCHQLNYMYRIVLIKSRMFKEEDIKIRHGICFLNIHQFLIINVSKSEEKWRNVDLFARAIGYKFGQRLPIIFNIIRYWRKRKTSYFSFLSAFLYILKKKL